MASWPHCRCFGIKFGSTSHLELHFFQVVQIVCCNLSSLQADLYNTICQSKEVKALLKSGVGGGCTVLSSITALKKLCNHPKVKRTKRTNQNYQILESNRFEFLTQSWTVHTSDSNHSLLVSSFRILWCIYR
jgi:SNF2 family DNA or RNA helicase